MELWVLFLLLGLLCAAIGLILSKMGGAKIMRKGSKEPREGDVINFDPSTPAVWNDKEISLQLVAVQNRPKILAHYIEALKQRYILKTDDRTAQFRTQFLRTHIEQLEFGKQYRGLVNDLKAMEAEQENRLLRLELEKRDLQAKTRQTDALEGLRLEKERLAIEVEIGQMKMQKRAIQKPDPETTLTPEQQRRLRRMEIEDRIDRLDRDEAAAVKKSRSDEERVRIQNMYADKREELREQLGKHLV